MSSIYFLTKLKDGRGEKVGKEVGGKEAAMITSQVSGHGHNFLTDCRRGGN